MSCVLQSSPEHALLWDVVRMTESEKTVITSFREQNTNQKNHVHREPKEDASPKAFSFPEIIA